MSKLMNIPLDQIRESPVALRDVNRQSPEYLGLVDSIKQKGFLGAITVRVQVDKETKQDFYEIIDGLHRFCAAKDAGLTEIGADVCEMDDQTRLEAQLCANIHHIESKPAEYSAQLKRILTLSPTLTETQLATKLGKSTQWVQNRLSLNKLDNVEVKKLIDEGKINLSNAYALAKLPASEIANWIDRAIVDPPSEFVPAVDARVKEIRDEHRKGNQEAPVAFQPVAHMQKMPDVKAEAGLIEGSVAMSVVGPLVQRLGITDPVAAAQVALLWVLHMDPESKQAQIDKDNERKAAREQEKVIKDAERAAKKAKSAEENNKEAAVAAEKARAILAQRGLTLNEAATAEAEVGA